MAQSIKSDPPQEQSLPARPPRLPADTTYEEFLEWADEDTLAEWVDGVIVMTSPASLRHQDIANFLEDLFSTYVRIHDLGKVTTAPFQMKLKQAGREPDVLFVAKEHLGRFKKTYLDGPADLVVEIMSPESKGRDSSDKVAEYSEAGIPEYWLIDPELQQVTFYQLDESGSYQPAPLDEGGIYRSRALPGFWLRVEWLRQDPLPDATDVLLEIDYDTYASYLQQKLHKRE